MQRWCSNYNRKQQEEGEEETPNPRPHHQISHSFWHPFVVPTTGTLMTSHFCAFKALRSPPVPIMSTTAIANNANVTPKLPSCNPPANPTSPPFSHIFIYSSLKRTTHNERHGNDQSAHRKRSKHTETKMTYRPSPASFAPAAGGY
jgi:hypothetical protein